MFFPVIFVCVVCFLALIIGGVNNYLRHCMVIGGLLIVFFGLMVLVILIETMLGRHAEIIPTAAISLGVAVLLFVRIQVSGGLHKLKALWNVQ